MSQKKETELKTFNIEEFIPKNTSSVKKEESVAQKSKSSTKRRKTTTIDCETVGEKPIKKSKIREMLPEIGMEKYDHYFDYELNMRLGNLSLSKPKPDILSIPLDDFLHGKKQLFLDTFPTGEIHEN